MSEATSRSAAVSLALAALLTCTAADRADAQRLFVGGGVNAGTVPRALEPLCGPARRLRGVGLSGRVGLLANRIGVGATVDYIARIGVHDVAECIARSGIVVDTIFQPADESATSLAVTVWAPVRDTWLIGAEAGSVLQHDSWFVGPALGVTYRRLQLEVAARRHVTGFDEVTRDYGPSTVREISRRERSETSWGAVVRLLIRT